jgi:hypothetical protein
MDFFNCHKYFPIIQYLNGAVKIGSRNSKELVQVFIHGSLLEIRVKVSGFNSKERVNLKVGVVPLHPHRMAD